LPGFATSVAHNLGTAAAVQRLTAFLDGVRRDYGDKLSDVRGTWEESTLHFGFTIYGMAIQGSLAATEDAVSVSGKLPLAAAIFRGQVEKSIRDELLKLLS